MLTKNDLKEMGIHTDICGWYNVEKMTEILNFIVEIEKNMDKSQFYWSYDGFLGYNEVNINGYEITIIGECDGVYDVDISANGHTLAESESKILSHAISTAVMQLNGYKGDFSANKIAKIIEIMEKENLDHSDFFSEQWDG